MPDFELGKNSRGEPFVKFTASGRELTGTWENSMLFTHGRDDHIDHYYVEVDPDDAEDLDIDPETARSIGAFVWRQAVPDFDNLVNFLVENNFPHLHNPLPNAHDVMAYGRTDYQPPDRKKEREAREVRVIEEDDDDKVVAEAMKNIDAEIDYYLGEGDA